jgi:hypothetical protein
MLENDEASKQWIVQEYGWVLAYFSEGAVFAKC